MNEHIEHQVLRGPNGEPQFAVIPWEIFVERFGADQDENVTIPHGVIVIEEERDCSLVRAWREYLGLTQADVAERMEITQSAYAQMESKDANLRPKTLKKISAAMDVDWRQLQD
ncbi:helix-turn-helix domain-containing protein [Desulfovibrio inopinatus]|uniref:helix-turn-helix domain-containing protein n=1 Tax=Desulfovibrio inopinatus TaxID=102109 RepID=UPI0004261F2B|nr:helix-turn-helix transcriptional regulator [Desulfovibrio inopinatus]